MNPVLYEPHVRDAGQYVDLAGKAHGPIPQPLIYNWGDALRELEHAKIDLRIVNLENAIISTADVKWLCNSAE